MSATITAPGLVFDMPAADYHADPVPLGSLSATRAKTLLEDAGPARFRHNAKTGGEYKPAFDFGNAAHALALGKDADRLVIVDTDSYRTAAARQLRDDAYAQGKTPILPKELQVAEDMATELEKHPVAMESLTGQAEVSMFHQLDCGLWLRGRIDVMAASDDPKAMADAFTTDYKTTTDASSSAFIKQAWNLRYFMQAAWYRRLRYWLTGDLLPYRIVAQEKTAPYLVSVWEIDPEYLGMGEEQMDEAIRIYRECLEADDWPGYPTELQQLTPPDWAIPDMEV